MSNRLLTSKKHAPRTPAGHRAVAAERAAVCIAGTAQTLQALPTEAAQYVHAQCGLLQAKTSPTNVSGASTSEQSKGSSTKKIITTFLTRARRSAGHITGLECAGPVGLGVLIAKSLIKRDSSSPIFCILLIGSRNAAPAKAQKLTGS